MGAKIFLATLSHTPKTVFEKLIQPFAGLINHCKNYRKCKSLPDQQWVETGLMRTLSQEQSGRAFVQKLLDTGRNPISSSHFFETLKNERRLKLCREVNYSLYLQLKENESIHDPFSGFTELNDFDIYADDGHYHSAASHDVKKNGKKYPTLHFYSVNLRSNGLNHLTLADTS